MTTEPNETPTDHAKTATKATARHSIARYVKFAAVLFVVILLLIATTIGFRGDVPPTMLVVSAGGIAAALATLCALYDL